MDSGIFIIGFIIGSAITAALIYATQSQVRVKLNMRRIPMGNYLGGFEQAPAPAEQVECVIDEVALVFVSKHDREIARVPRGALVDVFCEEKQKLLPRLSSTKQISLQTLGINPANPKPVAGYCLVIDWEDVISRQCAVFQYGGLTPRSDAHRVQSVLMGCRLPRPVPLRFDERHCPFCREIIKKSAIVCKHCHSRISEPTTTQCA